MLFILVFRQSSFIINLLQTYSSEYEEEVTAEAMEALAALFEAGWASVGDQVPFLCLAE